MRRIDKSHKFPTAAISNIFVFLQPALLEFMVIGSEYLF